MATALFRAASPRLPLAPGPRYRTPFSFLRAMRADTLGFLEAIRRRDGDIACIRIGPLRSCAVFHPSGVQRVLVDNHRNYWKGSLFGKLKQVSGEGLLFSEGEKWRRQRRLVAPAFQRSQVQAQVPVMAEVIEAMLTRWERERRAEAPFDLLPEMSQLALDIVCRALFGADPPEGGGAFHERVNEAIAYANYLINNFATPPIWVPTPRNRRAQKTRASIDGTIFSMIHAARQNGPHAPGGEAGAGLMPILLGAQDTEGGEGLSDAELRDQMLTLLIAGHETTAVALCWAFHLLGQNPDAANALRSEAERVLGSSDRIDAAQVAELQYARRVVMETLRLYPPAWATVREAYEEDEIGGFRIPRKANITLSPWITQRHPALWEEPERFDPERFLPERCEARPRFAYFPFGGGGRRCVGEEFAMLEATLVLALLVRRFDVRPVPDRPVVPDPILTLRPRDGLRVRIEAQ